MLSKKTSGGASGAGDRGNAAIRREGYEMIVNVLTIAGSDSGGGAGIQADLKTFSALGTYGASVVTALTAQNTQTVTAIHDVPPDFVGAQLDAVFDDIRIDAVKIGMLSRPATIGVVAERLQRYGADPIVVDPVMVAKGGDQLLQPEAVAALRDRLLPLATLITPNLPEAGVLLGVAPPTDQAEMVESAVLLRALGPKAVLLKGGRLEGEESIDVLDTGGEQEIFRAPRVATANTHGTGCTLSAAIAALLGRGLPLREAIARAKAYITAAIQSADQLSVGRGHGPVQHFHALWKEETRSR